jgi:hypothetical protein
MDGLSRLVDKSLVLVDRDAAASRATACSRRSGSSRATAWTRPASAGAAPRPSTRVRRARRGGARGAADARGGSGRRASRRSTTTCGTRSTAVRGAEPSATCGWRRARLVLAGAHPRRSRDASTCSRRCWRRRAPAHARRARAPCGAPEPPHLAGTRRGARPRLDARGARALAETSGTSGKSRSRWRDRLDAAPRRRGRASPRHVPRVPAPAARAGRSRPREPGR